MKNILYISVLLVTSIGYSQDKVSAKSTMPTETIMVKNQVLAANTTQNKIVEKMADVIEKQNSPIENVIINYIGTPIAAYVESVAVLKKDRP